MKCVPSVLRARRRKDSIFNINAYTDALNHRLQIKFIILTAELGMWFKGLLVVIVHYLWWRICKRNYVCVTFKQILNISLGWNGYNTIQHWPESGFPQSSSPNIYFKSFSVVLFYLMRKRRKMKIISFRLQRSGGVLSIQNGFSKQDNTTRLNQQILTNHSSSDPIAISV